MKNQVAEKIFENFWKDKNLDAINHAEKRKAIKEVYSNIDTYFKRYSNSENKLEFFQYSLPYIGEIGKYHLARNLGFNMAKPDRHLMKISNYFGFNDVQEFYKFVSEDTKDEIIVIDYVFWRFANLNLNYIDNIERIILNS
ncbi:MAG: hypothetical protein GF311_12570 [Candidatus Lokiarchaeota archaeon]|nr:hypothetical protein [Candidatus Lokiarchaeota archaeon]